MEEHVKPAPETSYDQRLQTIALVVGVIIMGAKLVGWYITQSTAILSDALESVVNLTAGAFSLYALWLAARPRDKNHPYGHGKVEFFSALNEGILIAVAGLLILYESISGFWNPHALNKLDLGLVLTAAGGLGNYIMGWILEQKGKERRSLALEAEGKHLKSDAYSSLGLILGLGVILLTNWIWLDNVLGLIFGLIILYTGYQLVRRSAAGMMDEADEEVLLILEKALQEIRRPEWIDLHNIRVIRYGRMWHIDAHLTLPWYWSVQEAHFEMERFNQELNEHLKEDVECFIHLDPCMPSSCKICQIQECPHRKEPAQEVIPWNRYNLVRNRQHGR